MRSAGDFDSYYKSPDPWGIGQALRRDRALGGIIRPYVAGKSVLELGCGEGHLTASVFRNAARIKGIDISPIAISRANALSLPNASFQTSDFLDVSFAGYDVIAAIDAFITSHQVSRKSFTKSLQATILARLSSFQGQSSARMNIGLISPMPA